MRGQLTTVRVCAVAVVALLPASLAARAQTAPPAVHSSADTVVFLRIAPPSPRATMLSNERLDSLHRVLRLMETQAVGSPAWVELQDQVTGIIGALSQETGVSVRLAPSAPREFLSGTLSPTATLRDPMAPPRGWIGLSLDGPHDATLTPDGEAVHYFEYPLIVSVDPNSPADRSGISRGDVLVAYDGADLRDSWINMNRLLQPDRKITVTVRREGQTKRYRVTVDSAPASMARQMIFFPTPGGRAPLAAPMPPPAALLPSIFAPNAMFGATLSDVTPELSNALSIPAGVLVNGAPAESPAYKGGLRVGDVVTRAGGAPVASVNQFRRAVLSHSGDRQITLEVRRKGATRQITLRW